LFVLRAKKKNGEQKNQKNFSAGIIQDLSIIDLIVLMI